MIGIWNFGNLEKDIFWKLRTKLMMMMNNNFLTIRLLEFGFI
jgi:hypothetical protein